MLSQYLIFIHLWVCLLDFTYVVRYVKEYFISLSTLTFTYSILLWLKNLSSFSLWHIFWTKLNDFLYNVLLNNRSFWVIPILHISFQDFYVLSTRYIYLKWTRSHNQISLTKWTTNAPWHKKWRKVYFQHKIIIISFLNSYNLWRPITFLEMILKNKHNQLIATPIVEDKMLWIAISKICCINIWQSRDFKRINFKYCTSTQLLTNNKYSYETYIPCKHSHKIFFSFF